MKNTPGLPNPLDFLRRLPDPAGIFHREEEAVEETPDVLAEASTPTITTEGCAYGFECIRDHLLRAHLYLLEAIRFSAGGEVTPAARQKVLQARQQLLAEDDFQAAMAAGPPLSYEVMKLLAATRSTWKAIEASGLDRDGGTLDELQEVADAVKGLCQEAYRLDAEFRKQKEDAGS